MMDRGHWANLARVPGLHPYSFESHYDIMGFLWPQRVRPSVKYWSMVKGDALGWECVASKL